MSLVQALPGDDTKLVSLAAGFGVRLTPGVDPVTGGAYLSLEATTASGGAIIEFINDGAALPNSAGVYEGSEGSTVYLRSVTGGAGVLVSQTEGSLGGLPPGQITVALAPDAAFR
ncbi:MAG: hypothetical protein EBU54_15360, partial [Mycobacteriaceae bacterium]|nr:hypothetical protein [Mycobacteriaceae bacterium]